jgi:MYXO-CTERM domain-containing protein
VVAAERLTIAALAGVLSVSFARDVSAYCRATTCDPKHETCKVEGGCVVDGAPLHWDTRCLSFGAQKDGSPLRHITYKVADEIIRSAFGQWMQADCGRGSHPSFQMWDIGAPFGGIICEEPEFNSTRPNANVWLFRDTDWPYAGESSTLALTSTIFEKNSGALLDADVEINSFTVALTTTSISGEVKKDLASIVTHEAGHFLGLGHSQVPQATMFAQYSAGDLNYRSLHPDDEAGICAIYPPVRDTPMCVGPTPAHGFSRYCGGGEDDGTASVRGCAVSSSRGSASALGGLLVAAVFGVARLRRRKKS